MKDKKVQVKDKKDNFSVALGLFDYINPIFYAITTFTIAKNMYGVMSRGVFIAFCIGAVVSLIFGLTIPTVKFIVGLGIMQFKMPVNLVFYVNSGILISGLALFYTVISPKPVIFICMLALILAALFMIYRKTKKFNTVAVLTGAAGYLLIYATMITLCVRSALVAPVVLYAIAICLFVSLCLIGIKANLKDARVHWVIEICNVLCQMSVAIGTILAFKG